MLDAFIIEKIRRREDEARDAIYAPVPGHRRPGPGDGPPQDTRPDEDAPDPGQSERGMAIIDFTI